MRNAIPPIGLFGKLPSHPDFIRLNAGSPLARAIDQWLQEGMSNLRSQIGEGWEAVFDRAVPVFFVYRDRDASSALVGVSRPSRDQTGRRYPFSIFSHVQLGRNGNGFHVLPLAYARFLKAAKRLLETDCANGIDNAKAARVMNLASTLPQNLVEFETKFNQFVARTTMESFWKTLFPDFNDQRKYLVIKNLFSALVPRRGQDASRFAFSLHLPASENMDAAVEQIGVWYALCQGALGGKGLEQSSVFWHADAPAPARGCYLHFRPPTPMSVTNLFVPGWEDGSILFVALKGAETMETARGNLGERLAGALDDRANGMKDFIKAIAAG